MKAVLLPTFASDENHLNMQNHTESSALSTGTYSTNSDLRNGSERLAFSSKSKMREAQSRDG